MNQKILHTPDGLRDIYGAECERKLALEAQMQSILHAFGYRDIETPTFEYFDVFGSEVGTIPSKDLYKFFDREGNTLVLRPDFTPAIARAASRYFSDSKKPVRLCYSGPTFVNHQEHRGRLKEITELGAELIGEASADADAELIAMAAELLAASGLSDFQISVGNVAFFECLVEEAGLDQETGDRLRLLIHNHNVIGVEKVIRESRIDPKIASILVSLTTLTGGEEVLEKAYQMSEGLKARDAVSRLMDVFRLLKVYGVEQYVSFDFGMLSAYMYYTGIIFRAYTYGTGGAVVKGGRYDQLLKHFGKDAPSIGFVVVLDDLMNALQRQKIDRMPKMKRILILYRDEMRETAARKAVEIRRAGGCAELMKSDTLSPEEMNAYSASDRENEMCGNARNSDSREYSEVIVL